MTPTLDIEWWVSTVLSQTSHQLRQAGGMGVSPSAWQRPHRCFQFSQRMFRLFTSLTKKCSSLFSARPTNMSSEGLVALLSKRRAHLQVVGESSSTSVSVLPCTSKSIARYGFFNESHCALTVALRCMALRQGSPYNRLLSIALAIDGAANADTPPFLIHVCGPPL